MTLRFPARTARAALAWVIILAAGLAFAQEGGDGRLPIPVARALKAAGIPPTAVAVMVQDVGSRIPRISFNSATPMNPASVMKLLTTYAALELLGPAYTWRTEVYAAGQVRDGVLNGDIVLRGSGDPKLSFEAFWLLLRQVRVHGIRDIRGDLVLDRTRFALPPHDPALFDQQPLRPYNVGPDALLINFKTVRLQFVPSADGSRVDVVSEPQPAQLDVVNLIAPAAGSCADLRDAIQADIVPTPSGARLVLSGAYPVACGERQRNVSPLTHPQFIEGVFRQLWTELGGSLKGAARDGEVPPDARLIASADSPPLTEAVRDINKFSNNVMARQLFLTLGAEKVKRLARPEDGEEAVREWLVQRELRFPELVLENGSGLSRQERISADSLARLLATAYQSPLMPEFISSLPLAAVDGTMKKRVADRSVAGHAHVKTGSLEGVRAAAGYVLDRRGRRHIIVFLVNHPNAAASQAAQDALLQCVFERDC